MNLTAASWQGYLQTRPARQLKLRHRETETFNTGDFITMISMDCVHVCWLLHTVSVFVPELVADMFSHGC